MEIINVENILLMGMPGNPTYHIAKADALFALGRFKEAKAIYMRFPRMATKQLEELKKRGY
jgi:predicted RNA polymerase sigma factor